MMSVLLRLLGLLHQWVLRHHRAIKGDGDITLEVGLQPWMDASSIGDKSTMLALLIFRPSDMEQMDESQAHRFLRPPAHPDDR